MKKIGRFKFETRAKEIVILIIFIAVTSFGATTSISLDVLPTSSPFAYALAFSFLYNTFIDSGFAIDVLLTFIVASIITFAPSIDWAL